MALFNRVQVAYTRTSGLPEDVMTNTLYYQTNGIVDEQDAAQEFEDQWLAAVNTGNILFSNAIFLPVVIFRHYDMEDVEPRVPFREESRPLSVVAAGTPIPSECCCVVSFQGSRVSGINQARRRGRIYLPLSGDANLVADGGHVRITSAAVSNLAAAVGIAMLDEPALFTWSVYSPTQHAETGLVGEAFTGVTNGWVDREPDTQRRRGGPPGGRTLFEPTP